MTEFDQWYYGVDDDDPGYVRKEARGPARKAFEKARKIASLEELIEGRKRYTAEKRGTDKQFIKLAATWLNGECWADEFIEDDPVRHMTFDERREWSKRHIEKLKANGTYPRVVK